MKQKAHGNGWNEDVVSLMISERPGELELSIFEITTWLSELIFLKNSVSHIDFNTFSKQAIILTQVDSFMNLKQRR